MNEQYEEVKAEDLSKGDVVLVSFDSGSIKKIYLNETVEEVACGFVTAESKRGFHIPYSRFYMVEKAKNPLPTKVGSVVKHSDGWQFIRIGEDSWKIITDAGVLIKETWPNAEVEAEEWEEVA